MNHDQRFKTLIKEFFGEFLELFFPDWAAKFDFTDVQWLEQEAFPDPPEGKRREMDLVAKLKLKEGVSTNPPAKEWIALIHIEVEARRKAAPLRGRMPRYYIHLRERYDCPVLPMALFLKVGLGGLGTDTYEETFEDLHVLTFRYLYVGLPKLDAMRYLEGKSTLGVALAALMKVPRDRKAWFKAEALKRVATSPENEHRKFLLGEAVGAYLPLDESQQQHFDGLMQSSNYEEARTMATTWYEQGLEQGLEQGRRDFAIIQLEERFGKLPDEVRGRIERMTADELAGLARKIGKADSLQDLGLQ